MTPLDSSHLEVFLGIFYFLNSNLNFEFGPVWYRPKPEPGRTGLTGNRSNRTGSHRFGEPWWEQGLCLPLLENPDMTGFKLPTGPAKPVGSGTAIPDRFGRKPVEVKFEFKILCANGLTGLPSGP